MSLERLAELTQTSKSYLWELENRESQPNPSVEKVTRIAAALQVTQQFLLESNELSADETVRDQAFFRKYQQMSVTDKARLRKLIDMWDSED